MFAFTFALALVYLAPAPATFAASRSHPLRMSITGASELEGGEASTAFARLRAAGIATVLTAMDWKSIAPETLPPEWNPSSSTDAHYDWTQIDKDIRATAAAGFQPIVEVYGTPKWARLVPASPLSPPTPDAFGQFVHAAAERYDGKHGLPRVRYWQIWNEPNISLFLAPQFDPQTRVFTSPDVYRDMVNAAAPPIHAAGAGNLVIAGQTAPFRDITSDVLALDKDWGPLKFMRRMLCVSDTGRPTCDKTVSFDVWSTHPYTSGGPTHHAALAYDVSLGDLPKMRKTLEAAARLGHIKSAQSPRFWVTEFSWDSNPPDHCSPPMSLLKRWVPEAFYRMWASGVELIAWFKLMDDPLSSSYYQSGLFFHSERLAAARPKPFIEAFRFPFVAFRRGQHVFVWAHTPFGRRGVIAVQQTFKGGWTSVKRLRADRFGIAQGLLSARPVGRFRAVLGNGEKSLPFSMRVPPDRFFNPFGQTQLLEPNGKPCNG